MANLDNCRKDIYVAWTHVTVTVGNFSRCFQEPNFKVLSKSGQYQLRYLVGVVVVVVHLLLLVTGGKQSH